MQWYIYLCAQLPTVNECLAIWFAIDHWKTHMLAFTVWAQILWKSTYHFVCQFAMIEAKLFSYSFGLMYLLGGSYACQYCTLIARDKSPWVICFFTLFGVTSLCLQEVVRWTPNTFTESNDLSSVFVWSQAVHVQLLVVLIFASAAIGPHASSERSATPAAKIILFISVHRLITFTKRWPPEGI